MSQDTPLHGESCQSLILNSFSDPASAIDGQTRTHFLTAWHLGSPHILRKAGKHRTWMDATDQRFANRCLPLLIANQSGWVVLNASRFRAKWNGHASKSAIIIEPLDGGTAPSAVSHFGHGILTWNLGYLFRTSPGFNLLVRGPSNQPKDAVSPLEGIVETDWTPATFTMNWMFTRADVWVQWERDEPFCMLVPQQRHQLEKFATRIERLSENSNLDAQHNEWSLSRRNILERLACDKKTGAKKKEWQKDYFQGRTVSGEQFFQHQTALELHDFEPLPSGVRSFATDEPIGKTMDVQEHHLPILDNIDPSIIPAEVVASSFKLIRRELAAAAGEKELEASTVIWPKIDFLRVNITLRNRGRIRASMGACDRSLATAVALAARKAAKDPRFGGPITKDELASLAIELWVQVGAELIAQKDLVGIQERIVLGIHGLEISAENHFAYFKPSVAITRCIDNVTLLVDKLCRKAGLPANSWQKANVRVSRTKWRHFAEDRSQSHGFLEMRSLRNVAQESISEYGIRNSLRLALPQLIARQKEDGSFIYQYDAVQDRELDVPINLVRMAGCAYALSKAAASAEFREDAALQSAAQRAVEFVLRHSVVNPQHSDAIFIANANSDGALGASALTLLALQFGSFVDKFEKQRRQLLATLSTLQQVDGSFQCDVHAANTQATNENFYPGEALLAMCYEAARTSDPTLRAAIEMSFDYYSRLFSRKPSSAFILWHADTWSRFHRMLFQRTDRADGSRYSEFVFQLVDWILQTQHKAGRSMQPMFLGGFRFPAPPTASSNVYLEAVACGVSLAKYTGSREHEMRYTAALILGLEFSRRLQFHHEQSYLFPRPRLAVGGTPANLHTSIIRCDNDQHLITMILTSLESGALSNSAPDGSVSVC